MFPRPKWPHNYFSRYVMCPTDESLHWNPMHLVESRSGVKVDEVSHGFQAYSCLVLLWLVLFSPGWPWTHSHPASASHTWDYRHIPPHLTFRLIMKRANRSVWLHKESEYHLWCLEAWGKCLSISVIPFPCPSRMVTKVSPMFIAVSRFQSILVKHLS